MNGNFQKLPKLANMNPFPKTTDAGAMDTLKEYIEELITHLRTKVNAGLQSDIADTIGIDDSALSKIISKEHRKKPITLLQHFENILKVYDVKFDKTDGSFSGGTIPEKASETLPKEQNFIGGPEGNHWRIMVEIYNRRTRVRKVGIRYLKINNLKGDVTFRVKIKNHSDYSGGKGEFMFGGHQLRFVFPVTEDREKMVYMRFIIGAKSAQPSLISGIMVHNYVDKHSNSAYIIFAENISKEDGPFEPEKMDFEKFKQWKPEIAEFFDLHNTFIHCPKDIYDLDDLRENNAARVKQNEEIAAQLAAEELKRINSQEHIDKL
jgi:hypothetical protein